VLLHQSSDCAAVDESDYSITDLIVREGFKFPVACHGRFMVGILNSQPVHHVLSNWRVNYYKFLLAV